MRRRISLAVLAALLVLPAAVPARAGQPEPPGVDATAAPTELPVPEVSPEPKGSPESSPEPSIEPPEALPSPEPAASDAPGPADEPEPTGAPRAPVASLEPPAPDLPAPPKAAPAADDATGRPDPTGRYIVILASDANTGKVVERVGRQKGITAERSFDRAIRGFTARLDTGQRAALQDDPNVVAVVPDEVIEVAAQTIPTGVSRVGTKGSSIAKINGLDERVNADVAIVDTGIQPNHPDLNVVGGYNCSTTNRALWRDVQGHGTHVAGTVGALDNTIGVVGVAPGARLWAVKILNDDGYGLLSWYVCGLDWILAQRDPNDSGRPLFEAVNMSVAKSGRDDRNCGKSNNDPLHQAICRVVAGRITVVAAAGNERTSAASMVPAAYNEVITVSALADTDGKSGGLGGNRCYSWGSYDKDDTFADFSNYGSDVDIIAPGKCIWSTKPGSTYGYSSGTSMATPAVTGAAALYKSSRPNATPAEVREALQYLGNLSWFTSTDPDSYHEKLLDVSKLGVLGTFTVAAPTVAVVPENGGSGAVPITIGRSSTFFERVRLSVSGVPSGWSASFSSTSLLGWTAKSTKLNVTVPKGTAAGDYDLTVTASNQGRSQTTTARVVVGADLPTAFAPNALRAKPSLTLNLASPTVIVYWPAATDLSSSIVAYELQYSRDGGSWTGTSSFPGSVRAAVKTLALGSSYHFRVRSKDGAGNWSTWKATSTPFRMTHINDRSIALDYSGSWSRITSPSATSSTITSTTRTGASTRYTFTGKSIAVIAPRSPSRGWLEVRVDGVLLEKVSLASSSLRHRQVVFARGWTTTATRTGELRAVTSSVRSLVSVDALIVTR